MSRTRSAILNVSSNFFVLIIKTFLTFITRTIFIYCLGKETLGLNGLFTNVLSMLSLAELGIGTAINFSLYEPLAQKDNKKVSSLMSFYKRAYRVIGCIVAILGLILIPFLHFLIKDIDTISNVYIIYILFLINAVLSYFIAYKETLITADQKNYKLMKINIIFLLVLNVCQIIILLLYKNLIFYLIIQFVILFFQKVVINIYISRQYKEISFKSKNKIAQKDMKVIKKNVKAMIFHKIGDYCINGTDNLIISSLIGITTVGLYSNYQTIIAMLTTFTTLFFSNITPSVGNLIVSKSEEKNYEGDKLLV